MDGEAANLRWHMPNSNRCIGRSSNNSVLLRMINDFGNFLGMSLQNGNHLFGVLVEYGCILIVATGQDLAVIGTVYVQCQNAGHTGRMQTLQYQMEQKRNV